MKIIWSTAALAPPDAKPHTDDMREMVEYFENHGLIRWAPATYRIGDKVIMHPALRARFERAIDAMPKKWNW